MVYREKSDRRREVDEFLQDFKFRTGREIETMEPDGTPSNVEFCRVHDIVEYPTLIAVSDDGTEQAKWAGTLPTISEASGF
jgi:hypothetical protein